MFIIGSYVQFTEEAATPEVAGEVFRIFMLSGESSEWEVYGLEDQQRLGLADDDGNLIHVPKCKLIAAEPWPTVTMIEK